MRANEISLMSQESSARPDAYFRITQQSSAYSGAIGLWTSTTTPVMEPSSVTGGRLFDTRVVSGRSPPTPRDVRARGPPPSERGCGEGRAFPPRPLVCAHDRDADRGRIRDRSRWRRRSQPWRAAPRRRRQRRRPRPRPWAGRATGREATRAAVRAPRQGRRRPRRARCGGCRPPRRRRPPRPGAQSPGRHWAAVASLDASDAVTASISTACIARTVAVISTLP